MQIYRVFTFLVYTESAHIITRTPTIVKGNHRNSVALRSGKPAIFTHKKKQKI